jgi:peptidyl-prolyl cis-trans isomerase C
MMPFKLLVSLSKCILVLAGLGLLAVDSHSNELGTREFHLQYQSPVFLARPDFQVTDADVDALLVARVPEEDRVGFLSSPERIGNLLTQIILAEAALARILDKGLLDELEVQSRFQRVIASEALNFYRERYLASVELESYESAARELHLTQPRQFMNPDRVDFEHLLIQVSDERGEIEAMAKIVDLHRRLAAGEDFAVIARNYSDDPTVSDNDGFLTGVDTADLVPQVAAMLAESTVGRYADPVRTRFGWHIVRLVEVHPGQSMSWEEAQPQAERLARQRHRTLAWERVLRDLQDESVEFADGAVARLLVRHGARPEQDDHSAAVEQLFDDSR